MADRCQFGGETNRNLNCTIPAPDDGLPVQCVGPWSQEKHEILGKYLAGSGGPRRGYLPPPIGRGGGAAFVDLFAGPGRARVRTSGRLVDGSPLIALKQPVGFTRLVLCELDAENVSTLRTRTASARVPVTIVPGDCNEKVADVVAAIPKAGLNVALVDPYGLEGLRFETIARLAHFQRMDLVLFFPIGEIRRNLERYRARYTALLNRTLGSEDWQKAVRGTRDVFKLIPFFQRQLQGLGYSAEQVRTAEMKSDTNVPLYHLVFASKHPRGSAIWKSITKRTPAGQARLFE